MKVILTSVTITLSILTTEVLSCSWSDPNLGNQYVTQNLGKRNFPDSTKVTIFMDKKYGVDTWQREKIESASFIKEPRLKKNRPGIFFNHPAKDTRYTLLLEKIQNSNGFNTKNIHSVEIYAGFNSLDPTVTEVRFPFSDDFQKWQRLNRFWLVEEGYKNKKLIKVRLAEQPLAIYTTNCGYETGIVLDHKVY